MGYKKQLLMENLIHPWITLQDVLDSIDMKQKELALRTWVTPKHINWIINWKDSITPEMALRLEKVLWTAASFWNNLQKSYDEDVVRLQEATLLKNEENEVIKFTCYKELCKYWLVEDVSEKPKKLQSLLRFFAISSLSMLWNIEEMAFRKYNNTNFSRENFIAWTRVGEIIWNTIDTKEYLPSKLKSIIPELKELTKKEVIDIKKLERLFSETWVRFVFVKWFQNNPVVWLTKKFKWKPFIQISDRWQKADIFWFTLFHEIGHVLLHLSSEESLFIDYDNKDESQMEVEADNFAQNTLIDKDVYEKEINQRPIVITRIAEASNVGENIIAWRIAHDYSQEPKVWTKLNQYRTKLTLINIQLQYI